MKRLRVAILGPSFGRRESGLVSLRRPTLPRSRSANHMPDPARPVRGTRIAHIGIAVRSIDARRPFYEDTLGAVFEGVEDVPDQKVRVGFFRVNDVRLELLEPTDNDYFVLKPKQSGFYSTTLDLLLRHLGARILILTGFSTDICVLFTASDAHLRDYHLWIPMDCVASQDECENERVLNYMQRVLEADIRPQREIDFAKAKSASRSASGSRRRTRGAWSHRREWLRRWLSTGSGWRPVCRCSSWRA